MLISVVIPIYNVEEYLHYAIDSLNRQTYKNFEVVLVDDGSTDGSGKLCDKYSKEYDNIKVYHKSNGGLSDARNFGVQKSSGDFITFLDPDDFLDEYALELMYTLQKKYSADAVCTKMRDVYDYEDYKKESRIKKSYIIDDTDIYIYDNIKALELMYYNQTATVSACAKLVKKEFLLANPFPKGKIYEDLYMIAELLKDMSKIVITSLETYNYYQRQGSIVNSKFSKKQYDFFAAIENNKKIISRYFDNNRSLISAINAKEKMGAFNLLSNANQSSKEDVNIIRKIISKNFLDILKNKNISSIFKVKYCMLLFSPRIFYGIKNLLIKRRK